MQRRLVAVAGALTLAASTLAFTPSLSAPAAQMDHPEDASAQLGENAITAAEAPESHTQMDFDITSHDGTIIQITIFRPAGSDADNPVPMVVSSHGWGGSRTKNMTGWMDAGFGGLSFDQRGFGNSGDLAYTQDPTREGLDVIGLLDIITDLDWVMRDFDAATVEEGGTHWGLDDPTVFAVGGSYGGGFQTMSLLTERSLFGDTRYDALAPEITWYDLPESLAPADVARSAWLTLLYGAAVGDVPEHTHLGYAFGASTGQFPDGTVPGVPNLKEIFFTDSPAAFVEGGGTYFDGDGLRINVPTLWRQGSSDTLFNLNQGVQNLENVDESVADQSYLIGYNGGHVLPTALPGGAAVGGDACSGESEFGSWGALRQEFFRRVSVGESTSGILPARYGIADMENACVWTDDVRSATTFEKVGFDGAGVVSGTVTTSGVGAPQYLPIFTATETTVITGIPTVTADYYSVSADQRVFFGLAKGADETEAASNLMQHQMMPHRELLPSTGHEIAVELGGGGMTLEAGETVYLVVSPVVELFFGHGSSRTPGGVALEGIDVHLPIQD